jgi:Na+/H+ antiporter NhaB
LTETSIDIAKWRVNALRGEIGAIKSALQIGTEIASVAASMRVQVTLTWLTAVLIVLTLLSVVIGVEASYYGVHHSLWTP